LPHFHIQLDFGTPKDGRADTFYHIGNDFGEAMVDLLGLANKSSAAIFSLGLDGGL
jgi:hypothetical protein